MRWTRRGVLAAMAVGIGVGSGCTSHPLPPLHGVVTRKRIVGRGGILLSVNGAEISVEDETLAEIVPREHDSGNTTITGPQARSLPDVRYQVTVRHENRGYLDDVESGEKKTYRTTRAAFNRTMVDDRIEFQVAVLNRPSLLTTTKTVRTGRVERKRVVGRNGPDDDGGTPATTQTVLEVSANGIEANRSVIAAGATVGRETGAKLTAQFDSVTYSVTIDHRNRERIYATGREQFDRARIGKRVTFEVEGAYNGKLARYVTG